MAAEREEGKCGPKCQTAEKLVQRTGEVNDRIYLMTLERIV